MHAVGGDHTQAIIAMAGEADLGEVLATLLQQRQALGIDVDRDRAGLGGVELDALLPR